MKNFDTAKIDNVLKSYFLNTACEILNTSHPVFNQIQRTTSDVWGKEIRKLEKLECDNDRYNEFVLPLKNLYFVVKFSKAIERAANPVGLIEHSLGEMETHISLLMSMELFADGASKEYIKHDSFDKIDNLFAPEKICGLKYIFDNNKDLYGLQRDRDSRKATILDWSDISVAELVDALSEKLLDHDCDMIITSHTIKRKIEDAMIATRNFIDILSIPGGRKAISINGLPLLADRYCPQNDIYILNTPDFCLHELCDWRWLEDNRGRIIRPLPTNKGGGYYAVLVKYCDLICDNVQNQTKIQVG